MTAQSKALAFAHRVLKCGVLAGLEGQAFCGYPNAGDLVICARHAYGPWQKVVVREIDGGLCKSETGSPMTASDVAVRLRNRLRDRRPDQRIGNRWKIERQLELRPVPPENQTSDVAGVVERRSLDG